MGPCRANCLALFEGRWSRQNISEECFVVAGIHVWFAQEVILVLNVGKGCTKLNRNILQLRSFCLYVESVLAWIISATKQKT
ncbi:hypothetical protein L596_025944 [Steinernema carpocapsae]|uniref:Uncharacterized protein n=1 Tax=Steinernema carpocapsae TaxID=34508 RepID=A0A4V5ZYZ9_STECR|nr:hypothetical protein L596_025944 [Steinernema carpocapsae]